MSRGIILSPKHGVNPVIPICFFCGGKKNEIALLGKLKGDVEAPKNAILDYEPCDKCKEMMSQGVTLIEVEMTPYSENQPPISGNAYPSGRFVVVKPEALNVPMEAGQKALMLSKDYEAVFPSK